MSQNRHFLNFTKLFDRNGIQCVSMGFLCVLTAFDDILTILKKNIVMDKILYYWNFNIRFAPICNHVFASIMGDINIS